MGQYIAYVLLGLGAGAVYSSLGISLVLTHRTSNVLNFATGAMAMYAAYVFVYLRQSGEYVIPIPGVPAVRLGDSVAFAPAVLLTMLTSAVLGVVVYVLVFGPLRYALPLTKVVASVALMLVLQASVGLRLGTQPVFGPDIFPKSSVTLSGVSIPLDRFYLAASVVAMAIVLWLGLRFTRAGLVSRAVADSERGSWVVGISPQRVACGNWALASVVAGLGGVLVSPLFPLIPGNYTLFAAPAFAAALAGRLSRLGPCVLAGFLIGSTQSVFSLLQGKPWWPSFLSSGLGDALPLLVIILILVFAGAPMPQRGFVTQPRLPVAHKLRSPVRTVVIATVLGVLALIFTSGGYRVGVITTFVMATLALSLVVVTGFVGQISLGNLAVAGVGAYLVAKFETDWGVPFPFSMLLAVMGATVIGMLVGLPALRVRGVQLAVVTMSAAVAIPAVYFNNPPLADAGPFGTEVNGPRLGGINLGIFGGGYPRLAFGFVALGLLVAAGSAVVWLRRGTWGGYLLAVRANERAAAAVGVDVAKAKILGFAISSVLAGVAGTMLAYQSHTITVDSFDVFVGIAFFAIAFLSGLTTVAGAVLAGALVPGGIVSVLLDRLINWGSWFEFVSGVGLLVMCVMHPEGIAGDVATLLRHVRARVRSRLARSRAPSRGAVADPITSQQAEPFPSRTASP